MKTTSKTQQILDIMFEVAIMTQSKTPEGEHLRALDREDYGAWIRKQLVGCGFNVVAMGASWGVLVDE